MRVETVHPPLPRALARLHPRDRLIQRIGLHPAGPPLRLLAADDQPRALEHLEVSRDCREIAGKLIGNGAANSPTVASPSARRVKIERRVGSASAAKVKLSWSVSI